MRDFFMKGYSYESSDNGVDRGAVKAEFSILGGLPNGGPQMPSARRVELTGRIRGARWDGLTRRSRRAGRSGLTGRPRRIRRSGLTGNIAGCTRVPTFPIDPTRILSTLPVTSAPASARS